VDRLLTSARIIQLSLKVWRALPTQAAVTIVMSLLSKSASLSLDYRGAAKESGDLVIGSSGDRLYMDCSRLDRTAAASNIEDEFSR